MRARPPLAVLSAIAALTVLVSACSGVVDGTGSDSVVASSSTPPTSTAGPATPSASASSPSGPPTSPSGNGGAVLVPLLERGPAGSKSWGNAWAANVTPTLEDFVNHAYGPPARPAITAELTRDRLVGIAHRTWVATDGTQADVLLFRFADAPGAATRLSFAVQAKAATAGTKGFTTASSPLPLQTYYDTAPDSDGYLRAITYTRVGSIVVEVFSYSLKRLATASILQWSKAQVELLR